MLIAPTLIILSTEILLHFLFFFEVESLRGDYAHLFSLVLVVVVGSDLIFKTPDSLLPRGLLGLSHAEVF